MARAPGNELVMKRSATSGGTFTTVGWIATNNVGLQANLADVTTHDDTDAAGALHRTYLPTVRDHSVTGRGVFKTRTSPLLFQAACWDGTTLHLQLIIPNLGTLQGEYYVDTLDIAGEQADAVRADISLRSAVAPTWTDATANY